MKIPILLFLLLAIVPWACANLTDPLVPRVVSVRPTDSRGRTNSTVEIDFSLPMDRDRVEPLARVSEQGGPVVDCTPTWSGNTLRLTPRQPLLMGKVFVVEVSGEAPGANGVRMAGPWSGTFHVGAIGVHPTVDVSLADDPDGTNAWPALAAVFDSDMNVPMTTAAVSLSPDPGGHWEWEGRTVMRYVQVRPLVWFTEYTVRIGTGARDALGYGLEQDRCFRFTFGKRMANPKFLGVSRTGDPAPWGERLLRQGASNLSRFGGLDFFFDRPMAEGGIRDGIVITPGLGGDWSFRSNQEGWSARWIPRTPFSPEAWFHVSVGQSLADDRGLSLGEGAAYDFYTGAPDSQRPVVQSVATTAGVPLDPINPTPLTDIPDAKVLRVTFALSTTAELHRPSVDEGITLVRMAGPGGNQTEGQVNRVTWSGDGKSFALDLDHLGVSNTYRLRFAGGEGGIRDSLTNSMKSDSVFVFTLAPGENP